jgi:hypothetical protein
MISAVEEKTVPGFWFLCRSGDVLFPDIPQQGSAWMEELAQFTQAHGFTPTESSIWAYEHLGQGRMHLKVGWPISVTETSKLPAKGLIQIESMPPFPCYATQYHGSMAGIVHAWNDFVDALQAQSAALKNVHREVYWKSIEYNSPENRTELQIAQAAPLG